MESNVPLLILNEYIDNIKDETSEIKEEILQKVVANDMFNQNPDINSAFSNTLKLESEIEVLRDFEAQEIPNDKDLLLVIGAEKSEHDLDQCIASLRIQKEINHELKAKKLFYDDINEKSEMLINMLTELIDDVGEADYVTMLRNKHEAYGKVFSKLRADLQWYLNSRYSVSLADEDSSVETVLNKLTLQFFEDPSDPYVKLEPSEIDEPKLNNLLRANIIKRHKNDLAQFRIVDCIDDDE